MGKLKNILHEAFNLTWDKATPEEINKTMISGAQVKGTNMCILILAIFIASIGLNMNSTAVIIGAMLISPLMGGIMAIGYGVSISDLKIVRNAAIGLAFQVIICIVTSTLYFALSPISTASSEILARTEPTIWDVLIAVCGGLAGVIGITRKEKSNVIPGVAIATALMPPLCTAGYGLATLQFEYFFGALYLFFINGFFICISTIIVISILDLPSKEEIPRRAKRRIHRNIAIIAVITILPSLFWAYQTVAASMLQSNVNSYIKNEFSFSNTEVVDTNVNKEKNSLDVALIGENISDEEIDELIDKLPSYGLSDMTLNITQTENTSSLSEEELITMLKEKFGTQWSTMLQVIEDQVTADIEANKNK
ncbi:MAG TPA: TIGR00341 family protein [Clostridiales bacterium]|nr:TIGR00341 family protein [Clostridiales bacterium]